MNQLITLLFHDLYTSHPSESGFTGAGADRYKLPIADFRQQLQAIAAVRQDAPVLVSAIPRSPASLPPYAITVDDGGLSYHSMLAPCLAERGWLGHCLVTTNRIGSRGFLHAHHIRELQAAGHLIGTHTETHPPRFDTCSWDQLIKEWAESKARLEDITGECVNVGSVPGGYYSRRVALAARVAGLEILLTSEPQTALWNVDGCQLIGRFTLRRNSPPGLAGKLVQPSVAVQRRQWLAWNAKKILKKSLGNGYVQLTSRFS